MKLTTERLKKLIREELEKVNEEKYFSMKGQDAWYQSILDTMQPKHKAFAEENYQLFKDAVYFNNNYLKGSMGAYANYAAVEEELANIFNYPDRKMRLLNQMVRILQMSPIETSKAMDIDNKKKFVQDSFGSRDGIQYGENEPDYPID